MIIYNSDNIYLSEKGINMSSMIVLAYCPEKVFTLQNKLINWNSPKLGTLFFERYY